MLGPERCSSFLSTNYVVFNNVFLSIHKTDLKSFLFFTRYNSAFLSKADPISVSASGDGHIGGVLHEIARYRETTAEDIPDGSVCCEAATSKTNQD